MAVDSRGTLRDIPAARRNGTKDMLPSSWTGRALRLEYMNGTGEPHSTTAVLLDIFPFGPVMNIAGAKTLLSWDCLIMLELVEDT